MLPECVYHWTILRLALKNQKANYFHNFMIHQKQERRQERMINSRNEEKEWKKWISCSRKKTDRDLESLRYKFLRPWLNINHHFGIIMEYVFPFNSSFTFLSIVRTMISNYTLLLQPFLLRFYFSICFILHLIFFSRSHQ